MLLRKRAECVWSILPKDVFKSILSRISYSQIIIDILHNVADKKVSKKEVLYYFAQQYRMPKIQAKTLETPEALTLCQLSLLYYYIVQDHQKSPSQLYGLNKLKAVMNLSFIDTWSRSESCSEDDTCHTVFYYLS